MSLEKYEAFTRYAKRRFREFRPLGIEAEDVGSEMYAVWLEAGASEAFRFDWAYTSVIRKHTRYDNTKRISRDPLQRADSVVTFDGESSDIFERFQVEVVETSTSDLNEGVVACIAARVSQMERENKRLKERENNVVASASIPFMPWRDAQVFLIRNALERAQGNRVHAAQLLGISVRGLRLNLAKMRSEARKSRAYFLNRQFSDDFELVL